MLPWVGPLVFLLSSPAENASSDGLQINSVDVAGSGAQIRVEYPAGLTSRLDVFATENLLGRWGLERTNLLPSGTDLVTSVGAASGNVQFFVVGTDWDSDGDGLSDMRLRRFRISFDIPKVAGCFSSSRALL